MTRRPPGASARPDPARPAVRRARGVFVTGTDTGVGKTLVACAVVRGLRARGLRVGAMKPIETGVGPDGPQDALALREAAGSGDALQEVCPYRFALPAAPSVAARAEHREIVPAELDVAFERLAARHALVVVEGAGGLLVPIAADLRMADLAARWALPLLVVARGALGTLNHTRLTLDAARARGLAVAGVVVSHAAGPLSEADAANLAELRREPDLHWLGEIPPLAPGAAPGPEAIALDALLETLGQAGAAAP